MEVSDSRQKRKPRSTFPTYPEKPTGRDRAVIGIRNLGTFDCGEYDTPDSVLTWYALRKIVMSDEPLPKMKELRHIVMRETDLTGGEAYREIERERDALINQVDQIEIQAIRLDELQKSLNEAIAQREEKSIRITELAQQLTTSQERVQQLESDARVSASKPETAQVSAAELARRRPWVSWIGAGASIAVAVILAGALLAIEPKVGDKPLSDSEMTMVSKFRDGNLITRDVGSPPMIDGKPMSKGEISGVRVLRKHQQTASVPDGAGVVEKMRQVGARDWMIHRIRSDIKSRQVLDPQDDLSLNGAKVLLADGEG